jgi:hypothetical protein
MFTASGLVVRFLKVFEKSDYTAVKWVRYLTKASGTYQIRVRLPVAFNNDLSSALDSSELVHTPFQCAFLFSRQ